MSNGKKPDVRIYLKPATQGEGGPVTLAAFWTDGERPSGGLDRRIKRLKVELEDGTIVVVNNTPPNRSHFCNLYREQAQPQRQARRETQTRMDDPTVGGEREAFDDDPSIPF